MDFISLIKNKASIYCNLIDAKKASKTLKFFIDEIRQMEASNFTKVEQLEILNDALGFGIKYQTYNSFCKRNLKKKEAVKTNHKEIIKFEKEENNGDDKKFDSNERKSFDNLIGK